jgi:hypothetical protein
MFSTISSASLIAPRYHRRLLASIDTAFVLAPARIGRHVTAAPVANPRQLPRRLERCGIGSEPLLPYRGRTRRAGHVLAVRVEAVWIVDRSRVLNSVDTRTGRRHQRWTEQRAKKEYDEHGSYERR